MSKPRNKPFIAQRIELVDHHRLVPADYNPRHMDERTLRVLVRSLARFGWVLPVVANRRTGNIVGGHQRARANAHVLKTLPKSRADAYRKVPVIYVDLSEPEERALNVALNQISGDWDFFKRAAADELRQNATFAQMTRKPGQLSSSYRAPLGLKRFSFKDRAHVQQFFGVYGSKILDFGCGRGQEVDWLKRVGVDARGFEPFRRVKGKDALDVGISRTQADQLLDWLAAGFRPETVFNNFVVSSIASPREREHVLTILQALGRHAKRVVIAVRSTDDVNYQQLIGRVTARKGGYLGVPDASEAGLVVTGAGTNRQKFQKFYERTEFERLLKRHWAKVEFADLPGNDNALVGVCTDPKPPAEAKLRQSLKFEFDVPINNERLGLADRAVVVFERWLNRK